MQNTKKPKKTAPEAKSQPLPHAYHVYADRSNKDHEIVFSGVVHAEAKIVDDDGFFALRNTVAKALDTDPAGKHTRGAFLTIKSLTYLGEKASQTD